jgi:amino acid permease
MSPITLLQAMGGAGIALIEIFILFTIFGASVAYLIFISDTMGSVVPSIPRWGWVLGSIVPLFPLVCQNNLSFLSFVSGVGLLGIVIGFTAVFGYGFAASSFHIEGKHLTSMNQFAVAVI